MKIIFSYLGRSAIALATLFTLYHSAPAQTVQDNLWVTNGKVYAVVRDGNTIYLGGDFTSVSPVSGGSVTRNRIAAFDAVTGAVTSWNPNANDAVYALAVDGSSVYAGGKFSNIGGQSRNRIAELNVSNGLATGWNPDANDEVRALAVDGSSVYAGGKFSNIGGQSRNRIARINPGGNATGWNPSPNDEVYALAVDGSSVYAGGKFSNIGGQSRNRIAELASSGNATSWNPNANGEVYALAVSGTLVYAGGDFSTIGAAARNKIAALTVSTGNATSWNPNSNNIVYALAVDGSTVYAGGQFSFIGAATRNNIAVLTTATGNATAWNPNANNTVYALAVNGSTVYAGGQFSTVGGQPRSNLVALSTVPTTFAPTPIPGGITYNAVIGTASGAFIAVGNNGQIRYTTNNGVTWLIKPSGISNNLLGVAINTAFNPALVAARPVAGVQSPTAFGSAISCGVGGTILRSTDGGDTWVNENDASVPDVELRGIAVSDNFVSAAKGASTVQAPTAFGSAISCGVGGTILRSTDGGETWTNESTGTADLNSVAITNDFSAAGARRITGEQASQNRAGVEASQSRAGVEASQSRASLQSGQAPTAFGTAISCGVGGTILRSTDGGDTWVLVSTSNTNTLKSVSIYGDATARKGASVQSPTAFGTAISCGVGGTILRSIDGGESWTSVASGTTQDLESAQMTTESVGYISGRNGTVLRTTDGGLSWANLSPSTAETLNEIFVLPTGVGVTVGSNGAAFTTSNGGGGDNPLPVELSAFSGSSNENGVRLNWTTASEKDNAGFVLMRIAQGGTTGAAIADYQSNASLAGKGTTGAATQYAFTDALVEAGKTYTYALRSVDYSGTTHDYPQSVTVEVRDTPAGKVYEYALSQNYPNPFNPATVIRFSMKEAGAAAIKIYDVLGRLVQSQTLNAAIGQNDYRFDGTRLGSGLYFYRLEVGSSGSQQGFSQTRKMLLVK